MSPALIVALGILLSHLALGALTYYYRRRALSSEGALSVMKDIGAQWRASNAQLAERVRSAELALKRRHEKEAADDAVVQKRAGGDADLAVRLLVGLSGEHPGSNPGPGPELQSGGLPEVPADPPRGVRRR